MATSKITEKPLVTDLKDDASFYIAQKESVNGAEVTALRRIAREALEDELGLTAVKEGLTKKADKSTTTQLDRRLTNVELLAKGVLYTEEVDDDAAYTKVVPSGAVPYNPIDMIGGQSYVANQLATSVNGTETKSGVTFTKNSDGSYRISGTKTEGTTNIFKNINYTNGVDACKFIEGHKYYFPGTVNGIGIRVGYNGTNPLTSSPDTLNARIGTAVRTTSEESTWIRWQLRDTVTEVDETLYPNFVDLTEWFGPGSEPSELTDPKIALVERWLAENPDYKAPTVERAVVTGVESVGFNIWDGTYTAGKAVRVETGLLSTMEVSSASDYVKVLPLTKYYLNTKSFDSNIYGAAFYDKDKTFIKGVPFSGGTTTKVGELTTPAKARYIRFSFYPAEMATTCLNLYDESLNGQYKPYNPSANALSPIPVAIQALDGYGWSAGSVYNYVDFKEKKYHKRVGRVDLGEIEWSTIPMSNNRMAFTSPYRNWDSKPLFIHGLPVKSICPKGVATYQAAPTWNIGEYVFTQSEGVLPATSLGFICSDTEYIDAEAFKAAMSGVYLYYELATEAVTDLSDILTEKGLYVPTEVGGTITFVNENLFDVPNKETYAIKVEEAV